MPTPEENKIYEQMFADPEPHDEDDPAYKLEQFRTMKFMGWKPEELIDPEERAEYLAWLAKNPD